MIRFRCITYSILRNNRALVRNKKYQVILVSLEDQRPRAKKCVFRDANERPLVCVGKFTVYSYIIIVRNHVLAHEQKMITW